MVRRKRNIKRRIKRNTAHRVRAVDPLENRVMLSANPVARIVNGTTTNGFPSVGTVGDTSKKFCTGTLITSKEVLTAAHCVSFLTATGGSFTAAGKTVTTADIVVHPSYNALAIGSDSANDIAIMRFENDVAGITPSPIFTSSPIVGEVLTLVGFGAGGTGFTGHDNTFGTKRFGTTPIDSISSTLVKWVFQNQGESNTAPGDSGGPNFLNANGSLAVAAVTSGGSQANAAFGDNSFSTRVDAYKSWIQTVINSTLVPGGSGGGGGGGGSGGGGGTLAFSSFKANSGAFGSNSSSGLPFSKLHKAKARNLMEIEYSAIGQYFKFSAKKTGRYSVRLKARGGDLDPLAAVYNSKGKLMRFNDDFGKKLNSFVRFRAVRGKVYYVEARGVGDSTGKFNLAIKRAPKKNGSGVFGKNGSVDDRVKPTEAFDRVLADWIGDYHTNERFDSGFITPFQSRPEQPLKKIKRAGSGPGNLSKTVFQTFD